MPVILVTDHTVTQISQFSALVTAEGPSPVLICAYPQRDGQAESTWVAGKTEINFRDRDLFILFKYQRQKDPNATNNVGNRKIQHTAQRNTK